MFLCFHVIKVHESKRFHFLLIVFPQNGKWLLLSDLPSPVQPGSSPSPPKSTTHDCKPAAEPKPTFRVTCTRGGRKHTFSSMDAAGQFGAGIGQYFGWSVKLKDPDIEVLLNIMGDSATIGIALSKEGLFKRNITHFGPTTLRSTIAYGLLRYSHLDSKLAYVCTSQWHNYPLQYFLMYALSFYSQKYFFTNVEA